MSASPQHDHEDLLGSVHGSDHSLSSECTAPSSKATSVPVVGKGSPILLHGPATPPKSTPSPELTTPELTVAAANILIFLWFLRGHTIQGLEPEHRGEDEKEWRRFPCTHHDWDVVQAYISAYEPLWDSGFYKIRVDTFCDQGFVAVRMAGPQHEHFLARLVDYIMDEVKAIRERGGLSRSGRGNTSQGAFAGDKNLRRAARYASRINPVASSLFKYDLSALAGGGNAEFGEHHPDWSFILAPPQGLDKYDPMPIPGLILEIAYSQSKKEKDLDELARHYLLGTGGDDVQLMLAVKLEYRGQASCLIAYRRKVDMEDGREVLSVKKEPAQFFESSAGELVPGQFTLSLSDFGPELNIPPEYQQIVLDFGRLYSFRNRTAVENYSESDEELIGTRKTWQPDALAAPGESSPPEDVTWLEQKLEQEMKRVTEKEDEKDPDWEPPMQVGGPGPALPARSLRPR